MLGVLFGTRDWDQGKKGGFLFGTILLLLFMAVVCSACRSLIRWDLGFFVFFNLSDYSLEMFYYVTIHIDHREKENDQF